MNMRDYLSNITLKTQIKVMGNSFLLSYISQ